MNKLTGTIPPQLGKLQKLTSLLLWGNALSGSIPAELSNCSSLVVLDASTNAIFSEIPGDIRKLGVLEQLHLSDNSLTGLIPWQLSNCSSLTALQLDKNQLSSTIPWWFEEAEQASVSRKLFIRGLPRSVENCQSLVRLRLGENQLSGQILKEIGQLQNLVFLDLYMNHFFGGLPFEIANIIVLELLDIHNNYVTGEIPTQLGELVNLEQLDLSGNSLTGEIPSTFVTIAVLASWFLVTRNHRYMIKKSLGASPSSPRAEDFSYLWTFIPFQKLNFTIDNILDCLKDDNVIGKGYCSNKSFKLLLYNYILNGNLQQLLRGNRNLDWETKYKIAIGSAQGLAYLYHDCVPAILHKDVKYNNILLDSKYEAYLADFGLAKLMNSQNYHHAMSRVAGSYGYIAPSKHP
ncbi:hypothetical protein CRYUN_Cryun40dG0052500 [Craigia yunnanensis]